MNVRSYVHELQCAQTKNEGSMGAEHVIAIKVWCERIVDPPRHIAGLDS